MILGRSTVQWSALISSTLSFALLVIGLVSPAPEGIADEATVILPALGVLIGGYIAFLANTQTTPISDPVLAAGTTVKVQGTEDTVLVQPTPPGPVGFEGASDAGVDDEFGADDL